MLLGRLLVLLLLFGLPGVGVGAEPRAESVLDSGDRTRGRTVVVVDGHGRAGEGALAEPDVPKGAFVTSDLAPVRRR